MDDKESQFNYKYYVRLCLHRHASPLLSTEMAARLYHSRYKYAPNRRTEMGQI